jgi:hypothetical protein
LLRLRAFRDDDDDYPLEIPTKFELMQRPDKQKPLVRVRLSVHYRVHSRQMLCIGGSQIPLGWSFLSIAKVPMTWNSGDIWTCEVRRDLNTCMGFTLADSALLLVLCRWSSKRGRE